VAGDLTQLPGCHIIATSQLLLNEGSRGVPDRINRIVGDRSPPAKLWTVLTTA
jgi:hypothetical protein